MKAEIRSNPFTISRMQLMRAASMQYIRRMWPVLIGFPLFGLLAMILGPNRLVQTIGLLAFIWPFSIPARVILGSWSKAKRLMRPTWVLLEGKAVYFHDEAGGGMQLPLAQVRRVDKRDGLFVLETRRFNFALIPVSAFGAKDAESFERILRKRVGVS